MWYMLRESLDRAKTSTKLGIDVPVLYGPNGVNNANLRVQT